MFYISCFSYSDSSAAEDNTQHVTVTKVALFRGALRGLRVFKFVYSFAKLAASHHVLLPHMMRSRITHELKTGSSDQF